MTRVTVLSPSLSRAAGGIFEAERRLSQSMQTLDNVAVRVVGLRDDQTEEDLADWKPLDPIVLPVRGPRSFGYSPGMVRTLKRTQADLVHLHALWMYTSLASYRWARQTGRPYVVSPHGMLDEWALSNSRRKKLIVGLLYENRSLQQAACIHALNESEYQSIRSFGLGTPVCVIPNGVDLPDTEDLPTAPWNDVVDPSQRVLLFLGRIHPKKGLSELIDAWADVRPSTWSLVIIGWDDGGHQKQLQKQISTAGLGSSVHLLGPRFGAAKKSAFHHADGFILPSHSEGLPMTVLEAWSYRCPVIMTPQCNLPEGFDQEAALKVAPTSRSIASGLREFIAQGNKHRQRMGGAGRTLVEQNYTWDQVAREMKGVYAWLLDSGPQPKSVRLN